MVSINQVEKGVAEFLDAELIPKIDGWRKWVAGATLSMAIENARNIFEVYKDNEVLIALGVIQEDGEIDIDRLHDHFMEQAKKCTASFNLPFIGNITLKASDIDKLYNYIIKE